MKSLQLLAVCLVLLLLPGCWDYQKINDRSQIIGIGVDPVEDNPSAVQFTLQAVKIQTSQSAQGSQEGQQATGASAQYENFTVVAPSVHMAIARAQTRYDKSFYLGNLEGVVLNTRLPALAVERVINELMRDTSVDKNSIIACTEQPTAEILTAKTEAPPASSLDRILSDAIPQHGYAVRMHLWSFWRNAHMVGLTPYAPLLHSSDPGFRVSGVETFTGFQPRLSLGLHDVLFYNIMARHIGSMSILIPDGKRSFDLISAKGSSRMWVTMNRNVPLLQDDIHISADLGSDEALGEERLDEKDVRRYEQVAESYIEQQCLQVLQELQAQGTDICGFGRRYLISNPAEEAFVSRRWSEAFARAKPAFQVHVHIQRKGSLI